VCVCVCVCVHVCCESEFLNGHTFVCARFVADATAGSKAASVALLKKLVFQLEDHMKIDIFSEEFISRGVIQCF